MIDPPLPPASPAPEGDTHDSQPGTRPLPPGMPDSSDIGTIGSHGRLRRLRDNLALRLPATLRGAAVDPALRGTLALALVAVVGAAMAVWFAWSGRPTALPGAAVHPVSPVAPGQASSPATPPTGGTATGGTGAAHPGAHGAAGRAAPPTPAGAGEEIVVEVAGLVARPGVVTLPPGSRVVDAVDAAGGVLPGTDTTGIGLARRLTDGEQVLVDGRPGPAPPPPPAGGAGAGGGAAGSASASGTAGAPLDLNAATVDDFDSLPGVGPVLAQRIVEWRQAHGGFTSPEQLGEVTGIGDKRLAELLPLVTVR